MAARKIKNQPVSLVGSPVAIYYDSDFGQYQVKVNGYPNSTYYADSKNDAFSTAQHMRNNLFLDDLRAKKNPVKRKTAARTQKAAVGYVNRPSQITKKAPTKRLKKRRTVNLQSPRGVFPNPKKRDPTYWVITLHNGYLSYRSDSGYTGSEPYSILDGNTERQKAMSFIRKIGIKRGQYEILKDNPVSRTPREVDKIYAREIFLYGQNDGDLYRQQTTYIIDNLAKKYAAGKYDHALGRKMWKYWADNATKKYGAEFVGRKTGFIVNVPTREYIAELAENYYFDHVTSESVKFKKPVKTRTNPARRKTAKQWIFVQKAYGENDWSYLGYFDDTPEGSKLAIEYAKAYHIKDPRAKIRVYTGPMK